ncbi:methyltransferase domain-containing protein [Streptomyces sp. NPDC021225]|uniref:methyltransferase domain-containing protein n=1 Tax=Streptomyces sp. NPDC021225 TaxID=3365121 RepID=UPI0037AB990D
MATYDTLGAAYARTRQPDPRIAAQIHAALGNVTDVINVGAGTGSYEPPRTALAVEPSQVMIAQRPPGSAPAVRAVAEHLPLRDNAAEAAMALLTVHHWADLAAGMAELRRVARRRIVILTWDQQVFRERFWLVRDYLPEAAALDDTRATPTDQLVDLLGGARQEPVMVPHDCVDGFGAAYWRRPAAYLDPRVRAGISMLAQTGEDAIAPGLARLADDLATGRWHTHHAELLTLDTIDVGYRLLVTDLPTTNAFNPSAAP